MTLNVQNVHRWLTHISAVAYGSLSQSCQWLSPVTQTKLTKVHFESRELVLASVAGFVKTPALPSNLIIQWIEVG